MSVFNDPRLPERFWRKVEVSESGCWLWRASIDKWGYGQFKWGGGRRVWRAHRASYAALVGHLPDELVIDHLCRVTACVNPEHLDAVTVSENNRRRPLPLSCPSGHRYTPENTLHGNGARWCRTCNREKARRYRQRRAEVVAS